MRLKDLIRVCLQNLSRHKARTMLTVLGVIVGCCSVVIMLSIGIGMKEAQEKALAQMGDLTIITVYPALKSRSNRLDGTAIARFKDLQGVTAITPRLTADKVQMTLYAGKNKRYKSDFVTIVGIDLTVAEQIGYRLREGEWNQAGKKKVFVGESFAYTFEDTKRPEGRNMAYSSEGEEGDDRSMPPAFFKPLKTPLLLEMESGKEDGKKISGALEPVGILKEDYGKGMETSMGLIMDLGELQSLLTQQSRLSGKARERKINYTDTLVKVEDIRDVARVEQAIKKMGFRTSSMESIRKPMEQEARQKQMMLGGLGAVSLFVAALGITNTMIMSISERTREIGVMKSLGCFVRDVKKLFLLEAGCIGLLGGMSGIVISYGISALMNLAGAGKGIASSMDGLQMDGAEFTARLSIIPWWLAVFAVLFSILIGVGAGYYPANKAVGIPALEAIKHD